MRNVCYPLSLPVWCAIVPFTPKSRSVAQNRLIVLGFKSLSISPWSGAARGQEAGLVWEFESPAIFKSFASKPTNQCAAAAGIDWLVCSRS